MTARIGRVAIYARVSTRDHGQDPELQLVPLREWAAAHGGRTSEYADLASAADLRGRTAWRRLLDDARHRRIDVVAVWKLDRAFRSSLEAATTLAELRDHGVDFVAITQPIDTTTPTGRLIYAVLAAVAEMERDLIVERVREGMKNARRRGARIGRPSGTERPAFARQWPAVRAQVAAGQLSHRAAAVRLGIGHATLERLLREAD
jgi:DNA invertase Pin-like site-specific DNA recombinase